MSPDAAAGDAAKRLAEAVGRAMLARDNTSRLLGISLIEIAPGRARARMTIREDMTNGLALGHGGLIFTLADTAFAYACNSANRNTVAAGGDIVFVSPARLGETLEASAQERALMGRSGIYDVEVTDAATGRLVALLRGRSHRVEGSPVPDATATPDSRAR
jgi:acyl-CoA thioesterase